MELLAQAVELLSILTTKKLSTKEPRTIDRPDWVSGNGSQETPQSSKNPFARAIDRMMLAAPVRRATA